MRGSVFLEPSRPLVIDDLHMPRPKAGEMILKTKGSCTLRSILEWERASLCEGMLCKLLCHLTVGSMYFFWLLVNCYRPSPRLATPGAVFMSEMICEATIDRIKVMPDEGGQGVTNLFQEPGNESAAQ